MRKMIGAMAMVVALMATAASDVRADHERRSRFGFGFSFGDGGDGGSFSFGYRDRGSFRFDSGYCDSYRPSRPSCGRWETRTETYVITPGGWQQVWVGGCGCGHYEMQYVAPVYGYRTVRVWVNY